MISKIIIIVFIIYVISKIKKLTKECNLAFTPNHHSNIKIMSISIMVLIGIITYCLIDSFDKYEAIELLKFLGPMVMLITVINLTRLFIVLIEIKIFVFAVKENDFKNFNLTSDEANEIIKKFCFKKIKESGFETIREIRDRYYLKIEREEEKTNFKRKLREKIKEIGPEKKEKAEEFIKTNKIKEYWYNKFEDDTYIVFYHYIKFTKYLSFKEKAYFKL